MNTFEELYTALEEKAFAAGGKHRLTRTEPGLFVLQLDEHYKIRVAADVKEEVYVEILLHNKQQTHFHMDYQEAYDFLLQAIENTPQLLQELKDDIKKVNRSTVIVLVWIASFLGCLALFYFVARQITGTTVWQPWQGIVTIVAALFASTVWSIIFAKILSRPAKPVKNTVKKGFSTVKTTLRYVIGIVMVLFSSLLLLIVWVPYDAETPLSVYLGLTLSFGIILFSGICILRYARKRQRYYKENNETEIYAIIPQNMHPLPANINWDEITTFLLPAVNGKLRPFSSFAFSVLEDVDETQTLSNISKEVLRCFSQDIDWFYSNPVPIDELEQYFNTKYNGISFECLQGFYNQYGFDNK